MAGSLHVKDKLPLAPIHFLQRPRLIIEAEYGDVILARVFDEVFFRHTRELRNSPISCKSRLFSA